MITMQCCILNTGVGPCVEQSNIQLLATDS